MSKRARKRRKGKRLEAEKKRKLEAMRMWRKLAGTTHHPSGVKMSMDAGMFYCPYVPIMRTDTMT